LLVPGKAPEYAANDGSGTNRKQSISHLEIRARYADMFGPWMADDPYGLVADLTAAVPPGSYLALSQVASDIEPEQMAEAARRYNRLAYEKQRHRTHAEVSRFFDGLELIDPGVVAVQNWRPASETHAKSAMWGGVGRKPESAR
jgi:S-adenosyl methyltransferase